MGVISHPRVAAAGMSTDGPAAARTRLELDRESRGPLPPQRGRTAIASISIRAPRGKPATAIVVRAGGGSGMKRA